MFHFINCVKQQNLASPFYAWEIRFKCFIIQGPFYNIVCKFQLVYSVPPTINQCLFSNLFLAFQNLDNFYNYLRHKNFSDIEENLNSVVFLKLYSCYLSY